MGQIINFVFISNKHNAIAGWDECRSDRHFKSIKDLLLITSPDLCYNLRLGSGCNLGKDLRKNGEDVQLVKHKEYRAVSMLYIRISHEESIHSTRGNRVIVHEAKARMLHLLHEALTEILVVQLIISLLPFAQVHAASRRY